MITKIDLQSIISLKIKQVRRSLARS